MLLALAPEPARQRVGETLVGGDDLVAEPVVARPRILGDGSAQLTTLGERQGRRRHCLSSP